MRAQEVVVSDKKRDKRHSAVVRFKAVRRTNVEFECSVKTFDELFKRPIDS